MGQFRHANERREVHPPLYVYRCACGGLHLTKLNWANSILVYQADEELQRWAFPPEPVELDPH